MTTRDLQDRSGSFFSLTPERVLDAVEQLGLQTTGLCYPLNSLENRVYEVELDGGRRLVGKFYRPGRWGRETILDEHRLLAALVEAEIPVCAPLPLGDGATLGETPEGIAFALYERTGGRSPEELDGQQLEQLGRLLARIHNVSSSLDLRHRPVISPQTYGTDCLAVIQEHASMSEGLRQRYTAAVEELVALAAPRFDAATNSAAPIVIHGDCHRGNLIFGRDGWFFLDFDDMATAPPVQDVWLLMPGRRSDCEAELEAFLRGYEQFRPFDVSSLSLIEVLRGLRYVRYAAWVTSRWDDPAFPRAFPHYGTDHYWEGQLSDLHEQLAIISAEDGTY